MKYGSVCSGIEAASVAWEPLGWEAQWFSEIEQFPSAVLAHRFPSVPNLGDMTKIHETQIFNDSTINILVGGTPCQSFSVAGLRKGLADPRGNLMLTFLSLAQRKKPRWIVWENVPGVLSSNGGRDFATFLQALAELGYGFAYRVLDAQYFGVAQRRRRVFVVGYLGDWRPAGAVLFEQDCLSGNSKKGREKRKATTTDAQGGSGGRGFRMTAFGEYADDDSASTLKQRDYKDATDLAVEAKASWWNGEQTAATITEAVGGSNTSGPKIAQPIAVDLYNGTIQGQTTCTLTSEMGVAGHSGPKLLQPIAVDTYNYTTNESTTQTIRSQNDTEHIGAVLQLVPFRKARRAQSKDDHETWEQDEKTNTLNAFDTGDIRTTQAVVQSIPVLAGEHPQKGVSENICPTLPTAMGMGGGHTPLVPHPIAVDTYNQTVNENSVQTIRLDGNHTDRTGAVLEQKSVGALCARDYKGVGNQYVDEGKCIASPTTMAIRRLTPTECERLQGFPDGWTKIPYRGKPTEQCSDGPRYKACGNSMAVPVMRWIGQRIEMVEELLKEIS